jgi:2-desacetyl-2-hydroxyethyl bacteriochlorophyllide A dehydrogenase
MRRSLAFVGPGSVRIEEDEVPDPAADGLLVATELSAVSPGTELLVYRGDVPSDLAADEGIDALDGDLAYPLRYGYACVGEVVGRGADAPRDWVGETVFGFNPHQSHFTAAPDDLLRVPPAVDVEAAALLANAETAVNFALDGRPRLGERVAVFGQGLVGLLTTDVLSAFPLDQLIAVEPVAGRRRLARRLGADIATAPEGLDHLYDPAQDGAGADLALELSGSPAALGAAVSATGYDGRVLIGSWYGTKGMDLDLGGRFHRSRISMESSQVSTIDPELRGRWDADRRYAAAWDRLAELPVGALPLERRPVERAAAAYDRLAERPGELVGTLFTY